MPTGVGTGSGANSSVDGLPEEPQAAVLADGAITAESPTWATDAEARDGSGTGSGFHLPVLMGRQKDHKSVLASSDDCSRVPDLYANPAGSSANAYSFTFRQRQT